jgi:ethanolamine utilization microcompartment shell protein EutS
MKKYMQTQFVRFLLSSILITQNIAKDKFAFVPLQDFTPSSDIDWSQSVADIDRQLYKKYGLTDEETAFIERTIKPME